MDINKWVDDHVQKFPVEKLDPEELEQVMNGPGPLIGKPVLNEELDLVKKLQATTDAMVWAKEWCRIAREIRDRGDEVIDEGWMVGWFANAFLTAEGHARGKAIMSEDFVMFRRKDFFEFMGKMALPPWKDEDGTLLGGNIDCAPIAAEIEAWVDDNTMRIEFG